MEEEEDSSWIIGKTPAQFVFVDGGRSCRRTRSRGDSRPVGIIHHDAFAPHANTRVVTSDLIIDSRPKLNIL